MKKSEWLDCQRNEFFPKQKEIPSLVKIEHKNTATLDSARSKKKSKVAVLQLDRIECFLSAPMYRYCTLIRRVTHHWTFFVYLQLLWETISSKITGYYFSGSTFCELALLILSLCSYFQIKIKCVVS